MYPRNWSQEQAAHQHPRNKPHLCGKLSKAKVPGLHSGDGVRRHRRLGASRRRAGADRYPGRIVAPAPRPSVPHPVPTCIRNSPHLILRINRFCCCNLRHGKWAVQIVRLTVDTRLDVFMEVVRIESSTIEAFSGNIKGHYNDNKSCLIY